MLSKQEKIQYHRHLILDQIGESGQEKLRKSKVLVIGAGGLGCPILQYLTAAGVGTIGIVDGDMIDQTNLQRQILYTVSDIGKPKARVAAERLTQLNPHISLVVYEDFLNVENAIALFEQYDIIVDGSDNFPTRYLVNDACVLTDKPLVFGSIFKFQGQVSVFNFQGSGTYRCLYPTPPTPDTVPNCSDVGVLGVLSGIIGSLQANEVIKLITEIGKPLVDTLLYFDALTLEQQQVSFKKDTGIHISSLEASYESFCGGIVDVNQVQITAEEAQKTLDSYTVLDVRSYEEYELENIGGVHIPLDELDDRYEEIPDQKPVLVCCSSGRRSALAIDVLQVELESTQFVNLKDGLDRYFNL